MPLYLAFRGRWPDLAYGISGVLALSAKLPFQFLWKGISEGSGGIYAQYSRLRCSLGTVFA
jgi:hypothetical protein